MSSAMADFYTPLVPGDAIQIQRSVICTAKILVPNMDPTKFICAVYKILKCNSKFV